MKKEQSIQLLRYKNCILICFPTFLVFRVEKYMKIEIMFLEKRVFVPLFVEITVFLYI